MVFRFAKTLDPITLFHKPSSPISTSALNILKRASAAASSTPRGDFQLEITTAGPTTDQLRNILDYVQNNPSTNASPSAGSVSVAEVVEGARDAEDAVKRFKELGEGVFIRPVTVDWTKGKAVLGDNESAILKMVHELDVD